MFEYVRESALYSIYFKSNFFSSLTDSEWIRLILPNAITCRGRIIGATLEHELRSIVGIIAFINLIVAIPTMNKI